MGLFGGAGREDLMAQNRARLEQKKQMWLQCEQYKHQTGMACVEAMKTLCSSMKEIGRIAGDSCNA